MRFNTASYEIGYPVFDAKFLNGDTLLVTGGARGEAGQESMNRLTALTINFSSDSQSQHFVQPTKTKLASGNGPAVG